MNIPWPSVPEKLQFNELNLAVHYDFKVMHNNLMNSFHLNIYFSLMMINLFFNPNLTELIHHRHFKIMQLAYDSFLHVQSST